jgi:hypothetical protein
MTRRFLLALSFALAVGLGLLPATPRAPVRAPDLPSRVGDQEFWQVVTDFSEPNGYFRSDNLTSNELGFQEVIPDLIRRTRPGGVYLGVGPEQNFTYIVAVRPAIAIIFDIRRGNMLLQLMYKALFELAKDRADFVSMLFAKPRPDGLGPASTAADLFAAFGASDAHEAMYLENLKAIQQQLTNAHGFPLSADDLNGIASVYDTFYRSGFAVRPWPSYADLMTQTDRGGSSRGYLATEGGFSLLKKLQAQNLVIPIVGDFGGPKAIRGVGTYLKAHSATVTAFYLSNVEQYLSQDGKWTRFCRNVATLPLDSSSTFIRSSSRSFGWTRGRFVSSLGAMASEVEACGSF